MAKRKSGNGETLQLDTQLLNLKGEMPIGRTCDSLEERQALIRLCGGPRTARNIRKMLKNTNASRIPHLFSTIDTQVVVDILHNDLDDLIAQMIESKSK